MTFSRRVVIARTLDILGLPEDLAAQLESVYRDARLRHLALITGAREVLETVSATLPLGLISDGRREEQRE